MYSIYDYDTRLGIIYSVNIELFISSGIDPIGEPLITEMDYEGPMPTIVIPETDYYLYLSWVSNI